MEMATTSPPFGLSLFIIKGVRGEDTTMGEIAQGTRVFPCDADMALGFCDQMRAPVRMLSERGDRFIWSEGSDPDHYRFADAYDRVAQEISNRGGRFFGA